MVNSHELAYVDEANYVAQNHFYLFDRQKN